VFALCAVSAETSAPCNHTGRPVRGESYHRRVIDDEEHHEGQARPVISAISYGVGRVGSRHNVATQHLWNARHLARLCQERENELVAQNAYEPDMEQRSLCVSSVLASVAFLEALVNEVWQDAAYTPADEDNQRLAACPGSRWRDCGSYGKATV
jgi:hypothetical protein